jgi:hypothetical protein
VSLLKDKIEQGWVDGCPSCSSNFLPLSQHMSSLSLAKSCLWTVTRCVPLVQQKLLTFITAHEFTQPCSILSLNSDTMSARSAAETFYLYLFKDKIEQGWVNSCAVIKVRSYCCTRGTHRVTVQRQDWTRLDEPMCCSTWVHSALFNIVFEQWHDGCP